MLLKIGSKGDVVKQVQKVIGSGADGIFGSGTAEAVKKWQAANGLPADGIVGPATLAKMGIKVEAASAPTPNNAPSADAKYSKDKIKAYFKNDSFYYPGDNSEKGIIKFGGLKNIDNQVTLFNDINNNNIYDLEEDYYIQNINILYKIKNKMNNEHQ